jgi:hypothetical protein
MAGLNLNSELWTWEPSFFYDIFFHLCHIWEQGREVVLISSDYEINILSIENVQSPEIYKEAKE